MAPYAGAEKVQERSIRRDIKLSEKVTALENRIIFMSGVINDIQQCEKHDLYGDIAIFLFNFFGVIFSFLEYNTRISASFLCIALVLGFIFKIIHRKRCKYFLIRNNQV